MKPKRAGSNNRRGIRIRVEAIGIRYRWRLLDHFGFLLSESKFDYTCEKHARTAARRRLAVVVKLRGKVERVRNGKVEK